MESGSGSPASPPVSLVTGFEGCNVEDVRKTAPDRFTCSLAPDRPSDYPYPDHHGYWFSLRLENVKNRTVTVEIDNCDWMPSHWNDYKPVYCPFPEAPGVTWMQWRKIEQARRRGRTFSFTHRFEEDRVWVALRYPYTYERLQRFLSKVDDNPSVRREILLKTAERRNVECLLITDHSIPERQKRGIVVAAREHGVEQDGSWVCEGMIASLLSDSPESVLLRRNASFLVVPMVSPDAAFHGRCTEPASGYAVALDFCPSSMRTSEARAIIDRLSRWSHSGCRIDICISFHSPHGSEPNVWPFSYGDRRRRDSRLFTKTLEAEFGGFSIRRPKYVRRAPDLAGRCAAEFGALGLVYEINHQAKRHFLTVDQLTDLGTRFCRGIAGYLSLCQSPPRP